jgi:hypothetical protein
MFVTICSRRVPIVIDNDVRDDFNSPTYGLFRPAMGQRGSIVLDLTTPPTERRTVLVHEIGHAYDFFVGEVADHDEEGRQNRLATIDRQFQIDLADQGGEMCIHAAFGDTTPPADALDATTTNYVPAYDDHVDWPTDIACPHCRERYRANVVRDGRPAFDPKLSAFIVSRSFICGKCEREWTWHQRCSHDGTPFPVSVGTPVCRDLTRAGA